MATAFKIIIFYGLAYSFHVGKEEKEEKKTSEKCWNKKELKKNRRIQEIKQHKSKHTDTHTNNQHTNNQHTNKSTTKPRAATERRRKTSTNSFIDRKYGINTHDNSIECTLLLPIYVYEFGFECV